MSDKITWAIRQIPREVITAANMAAKKERKTLGKWLTNVILEAAKAGLAKKSEIARPEDVSNILQQLYERQEKLLERQAKTEKALEEMQRPWWKRKKTND